MGRPEKVNGKLKPNEPRGHHVSTERMKKVLAEGNDYRTHQIINLIREDDSDEVKQLAGKLAMAINQQMVFRAFDINSLE